jgi:hypothetical protein
MRKQANKGITIDVPAEYAGGYVAFGDFGCKKIIAHGKNAAKVIKEARKQGVKEPVIMFVPDPNITYIYALAG